MNPLQAVHWASMVRTVPRPANVRTEPTVTTSLAIVPAGPASWDATVSKVSLPHRIMCHQYNYRTQDTHDRNESWGQNHAIEIYS